MTIFRLAIRQCGWVLLFLVGGCFGKQQSEIVVYTALDQEFSEPILRQFEQESGIRVRAVYDIESTKTVGLYQRILLERSQPRCDVFWNNEILHTLRLERQGLLAEYRSPMAAVFPTQYVSSQGRWTGFAGRARVLLVNRNRIALERAPRSVLDLADSRWRGEGGMARPLFGTTATHAAVLFSKWGEQQALDFFEKVRQNAAIFSGNKQVAEAVSAGRIAFGLTDTDDALIELQRGQPVTIVWPDQDEGQMGTLLIPNTVAILRGAPHPQEAQKLVDYLLSERIESRLAKSGSGQIPLRRDAAVQPPLPGIADVRWMDVDFEAAAEMWQNVATRLEKLFP